MNEVESAANIEAEQSEKEKQNKINYYLRLTKGAAGYSIDDAGRTDREAFQFSSEDIDDANENFEIAEKVFSFGSQAVRAMIYGKKEDFKKAHEYAQTNHLPQDLVERELERDAYIYSPNIAYIKVARDDFSLPKEKLDQAIKLGLAKSSSNAGRLENVYDFAKEFDMPKETVLWAMKENIKNAILQKRFTEAKDILDQFEFQGLKITNEMLNETDMKEAVKQGFYNWLTDSMFHPHNSDTINWWAEVFKLTEDELLDVARQAIIDCQESDDNDQVWLIKGLFRKI